MRRKSKLNADDRRIMREVLDDHGSKWTAGILCVHFGSMKFKALRIKTWKQSAAFRFVGSLLRDYSPGAILNEMDAYAPARPAASSRKAAKVAGRVLAG